MSTQSKGLNPNPNSNPNRSRAKTLTLTLTRTLLELVVRERDCRLLERVVAVEGDIGELRFGVRKYHGRWGSKGKVWHESRRDAEIPNELRRKR